MVDFSDHAHKSPSVEQIKSNDLVQNFIISQLYIIFDNVCTKNAPGYVPEAFFKVIMRLGKNPQAVGVIFRNDDSRHEWGDYVNSVDQVERITGYDFFPALPDNIENKIEAKADFDQWPR